LHNIVPSWLMAPDCPLVDANNFTQTNGNSPVPKAQLLPLRTGKLSASAFIGIQFGAPLGADTLQTLVWGTTF
jgi:hypothetical protein